MTSNGSAAWKAYKKGAMFANPCYTQIHPTCIPVHGKEQSKLTLMSESLRNDGRVWVPKNKDDKRAPSEIPENERDYYLERRYPSFGNLVPRDVASRNAKIVVDEGRGVGRTGVAVYLDFPMPSPGMVTMPSRPSTATSFKCTTVSPTKIPTMLPCASIRRFTTPWEAYGWTTT